MNGDMPRPAEPKANRALEYLGMLLLAASLVAGAMMLQSHLDDGTAKQVRDRTDTELKHTREVYEQKLAARDAQLIDEEDKHARKIKEKDEHLSAFTHTTVRVRNDLEALLSDSRRSGAACLTRIDEISGSVGGLLEAVDEGEGLRKEADGLRREAVEAVGRLEEQNKKLVAQVQEFQQRERDRTQRITVTAKKK
jgi:hypothetical protein